MTDSDRPLIFRVGHDELVIRRRYEALSIVNDILIGLWFVVGSVLFFSPASTTAGTWLFLAGSLQLLIRPVIRLARNLHVQRISGNLAGTLPAPDQDF